MSSSYWEHLQEEQEEAEAVAWAATTEGQKAIREEEQAKGQSERTKAEEERAWRRDHPEAWAAWQSIQPFWSRPLDFATVDQEYGFEQFLKEVGKFKPGDRLVRKDDRLPFQPGNIIWSAPPAEGLQSLVVEQLARTLKEVKDSVAGRPTDIATAPADPNRMLTKAEVAEQFNVTSRTIDRWRASNRLKEFVVGGVVRFRPEDVAALKKRGMKSDR